MDKYEETKMGKKKAGGERRQATDFKEDACCLSADNQGAAWRKNGLCKGSAQGNLYPQEGQQPFRSNPNGIGSCTTTLKPL